jgi:predicted RNase H-like nuclease (RuvC/YqgF family)
MPNKKKTARPAKSRKSGGGRRPTPRAAAPRKKTAPRAAAKGRAAAPRAKKAAAPAASREVAALKARLEREKTDFDKRLTDTVREIAQLRHHEARAAQLERQLKERDEIIVQLRSKLNDLRNREIVTPEDDEIQPSLALGSRGADFDEFDEDVPEEDDDLI